LAAAFAGDMSHIELHVRRPSGPPVYGWSLLFKKHSMRKADAQIRRKSPWRKALQEIDGTVDDGRSVRFLRIDRGDLCGNPHDRF